ncbi:MAG: cellulase family glycosylhydrolase [Verrucomicrobiales bacterium]|nr:cellulase family glycosylhydrolase [Verrucomicrobiales bacterium]
MSAKHMKPPRTGALPPTARMPLILFLAALGQSLADQTSWTWKLAERARVDVFLNSAGARLEDPQVADGSGLAAYQDWRPTGERERGVYFEVDVVHFGWREHEVAFTASQAGTLEIRLKGPWAETPDKTDIFHQEVLFDHLRAEGVAPPSPGFETPAGAGAAGWTGGRLEQGSNRVNPAEGTHFLRVWHAHPPGYSEPSEAFCQVPAAAGARVRLRFDARAVWPEGFDDMAPVTNPDSPAHQTAQQLRRGINLSGLFDVPPGEGWAQPFTELDLRAIKAEGFDHVRLPVRWNDHASPSPAASISSEFFARVDDVVAGALNGGLAVVLDLHGFDEFMINPEGHAERFHRIWEQIGEHYRDWSRQLCFELLNEPYADSEHTASNERIIPIYAECIRRLRQSNPDRTLLVGPDNWYGLDRLGTFQVPDGEENVIVTVHCYQPHLFTHQGAGWIPWAATTGVVFPGPPTARLTPAPAAISLPWVADWFQHYHDDPTERNPSSAVSFRALLACGRQWSDYYGRPLYVGEFGAYAESCPADSRLRYHAAIREALDELGLGWAMWEWKAGFRYWDEANHAPMAGLRAAVFGQDTLAPAILAGPKPQRVSEGSDVDFVVIASGTAPLSFEWHKDGAPIQGADRPRLALPGVTSAQAGGYEVTVSNSLGAATTIPVSLIVDSPLRWVLGEADALRLEWSGPATLQWSDSVTGGWEDVVDAASPFAVDPRETARFYRVLPLP